MTNKALIILSLLFIPIITASTNPYSFNLYTFDEVGNGSSITGNLTNFTELLDTPSSYTGSSGDCVAVNIGETGLEFVSCGTGGGLTNTNGNYLYDNTTTIFFNDTFNNQTIISIGNSLYYPLTGNPSNFINSTQVTNISINNGLSTGIVNGGILGITPGNNTLFNISDGFGYIVNNTDTENPIFYTVEWTGLNNITPTYLNTNLISFIGIAPNGTIIQQTNRWTNEEARNCILIGVLVHVNLQNLDTVNQEQNIAPNPSSQVRDVLEGLGFVNVNGNVFSANGNNLNIDKSVGVMMGSGINYYVNRFNPHHLTLPSLTNLSFQYRYQNGSNDINGPEPMGWYKDIDPNNYDLNSVLTAVPNNKFTIQRIYSFTSNNVKLQRGQNIYSTIDDAKAGIGTDTFVTEPSIVANGMLRGFLILKQGTTDLTDTSEAVFIKSGKLGEETPSSGGGGGGGGSANLTNVAFVNQSNTFDGLQTFIEEVQIYNSTAHDNPRLSIGRNGNENLDFTVGDNNARILTNQDDDSNGIHRLIFDTGGSQNESLFVYQWKIDNILKVFFNTTGSYFDNLDFSGDLTGQGDITTTGDIDTQGSLAVGVSGGGSPVGKITVRGGSSQPSLLLNGFDSGIADFETSSGQNRTINFQNTGAGNQLNIVSDGDITTEGVVNTSNLYYGNTYGEFNETCPRRAKTTNGGLNITVGTTGDYLTIQEAVCQIPEIIRHPIMIDIEDGTYNENVRIPPVTNALSTPEEGSVLALTIQGNSGDINAVKVNSFMIISSKGAITPFIRRMQITGTEPLSDENASITVYGSNQAQFGSLNFTSTTTKYGILAYSSNVDVASVHFHGPENGFILKRMSLMNIGDVGTGYINGTVSGSLVLVNSGFADIENNALTMGGDTVNCGSKSGLAKEDNKLYCVDTFQEAIENIDFKNTQSLPIFFQRQTDFNQYLNVSVTDSTATFQSEQDEDTSNNGGFEFISDDDGTASGRTLFRTKSNIQMLLLNITGAYINGSEQVCTAENGLCNQSSGGGSNFDQDLNTTSNVTFASVNITGNLDVSGDTTLLGDVAGTKQTLTWGDGAQVSLGAGVSRFMRSGHNGIPDTATEGWVITCDGSITAIGWWIDTTLSTVGFNMCGEILINNALAFNTCTTTIGEVANFRAQARNIDTFSKGDILTARQRNIGTSIGSVSDGRITMEYQCDE